MIEVIPNNISLDDIEYYEQSNYDIQTYLKYQDTIKDITSSYIYIGDYEFDSDTQFLWKRIMLSNGNIINFRSNKELINYVNNNFAKDIRFENEENN